MSPFTLRPLVTAQLRHVRLNQPKRGRRHTGGGVGPGRSSGTGDLSRSPRAARWLEAGVLSFVAPWARPLAPQVTALPPLAAYHDLRWLFALNQSWLGFTGVLVLILLARSAVNAALLLLAWPNAADGRTAELAGAAR